MKILVTADLHYNIPRSRRPTRLLAREACATGGDALVLVGDTAGAETEHLTECLRLFEDFNGRKFLVAGNHCLWCRPDEDSLHRYRTVLPKVAAEAGFHLLDREPAIVGQTAMVGSVGWYDYSFRDESLGIPEPFYRAKLSPGAARYYGGHEELLAAHRHELTDAHMGLGARWMDGRNVRLPVTDEQFLEMVATTLEEHIREMSDRADRICVFLHHLPFAELVPANRPRKFAFAAAYMGAQRLGQAVKSSSKVTHVYCGHSHWPAQIAVGDIEVVNVGSTYTDKKLKILELP